MGEEERRRAILKKCLKRAGLSDSEITEETSPVVPVSEVFGERVNPKKKKREVWDKDMWKRRWKELMEKAEPKIRKILPRGVIIRRKKIGIPGAPAEYLIHKKWALMPLIKSPIIIKVHDESPLGFPRWKVQVFDWDYEDMANGIMDLMGKLEKELGWDKIEVVTPKGEERRLAPPSS